MTIYEWCVKHPNERLRFGYSDDCGVIVYKASVEDLDDEYIIELGKFVLSKYKNVELMFNKADGFPFRVEVILKGGPVLSRDLQYTRILNPNEELIFQILNAIACVKEELVDFILGRKEDL